MAILSLSMNLSLLIKSLGGSQQETETIMLAMFAVVTLNAIATILVMIGGIVAVHKKSKVTLEAAKKLESTDIK